jgi:hypothetical protein
VAVDVLVVAAIIVRLSDDVDIALHSLRPYHGGRRGSQSTTTRADLMASFARPTVQAATTAAVAAGADHSLMFKAAKTVAEYRLLRWLADANSRGVAPPTPMLLVKLRACWPVDGTGARSNGYLDSLQQRTARKNWAAKFRRRWGSTYKKMPARSNLGDAELIQKASFFAKTTTKIGPTFRTCFWDHSNVP